MCADGFGKVNGHVMFAQAVFVCFHWQMDGMCVCWCVGVWVCGWVGGWVGEVGTAAGLLCEPHTDNLIFAHKSAITYPNYEDELMYTHFRHWSAAI